MRVIQNPKDLSSVPELKDKFCDSVVVTYHTDKPKVNDALKGLSVLP